VAKVHRISKRHHKEAEFTHYARALDKIYTKIEMAQMVPQVVQKMRREYSDNPHELYLLVCKKYGITPEEKWDVDLLVYGRHKPVKHKLKQVRDKERVGETKERETEKKNEETKESETVKKTKDTIEETNVDEITDNTEAKKEDTVKPVEQIEEKKEELPQAVETVVELQQEAKPVYESVPEREVVAQSPRRAKVVERMYQKAANQSASQGRAVNEAEYQQKASPRAVQQNLIEYVNIFVGDICETMVLTQSAKDSETGFWIPARVISIDTETEAMDLEVLQPVKYNLPKMARNVPYRYVRAPSQVTFEY